jgi:Zn-dependent peptidase ImmA (M78 family)
MIATRWVDPNDAQQQRAEWEANWFAAAFLMAEVPFRAKWASVGGDLTKVAAEFNVSEHAARIRAETFGL